ncbi:MAG: pilus assembly protein TadE [Actinomycetota bacterium]|nr:pilus assembly protein TadE [Actinomycetota bacterium]
MILRPAPSVPGPPAAALRAPAGVGDRESGAATVLVIAAVAVILLVSAGALSLVAAVAASHRAHAAADLAALAGAQVLVDGGGSGRACAAAARVSRRNGAAVVSCLTGPDLTMVLLVTVPSAPGLAPAQARARAGPATP